MTNADIAVGSRGSIPLDKRAVPKWKLFGRQFLSMDTLADVLYMLSEKDGRCKLRVPLSALIDYKGFRCLAIAKVPVKPTSGLSLGFHEGKYQPPDT